MPTASVLSLVIIAAVFGTALAVVPVRVSFRRAQPTFRCKIRAYGFPIRPLPREWRRRRDRAAWVHDVLLVQRGTLWAPVLALPVGTVDHAIQYSSRTEVGGLGRGPVILVLCLDDGETIEVAAREADISALAGPFVAAAIPGLPTAPTDPHRPRGW